MLEPVFEHDCTSCIFVGHIDDHDLYVCPQHGIPTLVARFSSNGPDYQSGKTLSFSFGYMQTNHTNLVKWLRNQLETSTNKE